MKSFYCPIDTSLNYQQANKLIKELKPTVLVTPESYTKPHHAAPNLFIEQQVPKKTHTHTIMDVMDLVEILIIIYCFLLIFPNFRIEK